MVSGGREISEAALQGEAPPLYGDDLDEILEVEDASKDEYSNLASKRTQQRREREQRENDAVCGKLEGGVPKEEVKLNFVQPKKEKRFKLYFKYEGRRGPSMYMKVRLPKHGGYEDGPSIGIKKMFCNAYNKLREMLSFHACHLRSEIGIAIPDEDSISGYVGYGGCIFVVDGSAPSKPAENDVYFWGHSIFSSPKGDSPQPMLALQRKRVAQISVGTEHAAVVTEGGRVFTWGVNDFGQLGTGDERSRPLPVLTELPYEVYISQIACGGRYTLALEKKGNLWSWGQMQLSNFPSNFVDSWCNGYESKGEQGLRGQKIVKIAAGDQHMAALTKEGAVFTWGYNDYGQLGWGLSGKDRTGQQKPNQVKAITDKVIDIACGGAHTVAITDTNHVYGWGSNVNGQIGHGLKQVFADPQQVPLGDPIQKAIAGWMCTLYITDQGKSVICGGINSEGPAQNSLLQKQDAEEEGLDPVEVANKKKEENERRIANMGGVLGMLSGGQGMTEEQIVGGAVGEAHGMMICADGTVKGWGYNRQKQCLGTLSEDTFVKPPKAIDGINVAAHQGVAVGCGGAQTYAVLKRKV